MCHYITTCWSNLYADGPPDCCQITDVFAKKPIFSQIAVHPSIKVLRLSTHSDLSNQVDSGVLYRLTNRWLWHIGIGHEWHIVTWRHSSFRDICLIGDVIEEKDSI